MQKKVFFSIILILFLSLSSYLVFIPKVNATTTYRNDGFENFPTWWTETVFNGGIDARSNIVAYSGTYSLLINSTLATSQATVTNTTSSHGYHHLTIWTYINSSFANILSGGYLVLMADTTHSTWGEDLVFTYSVANGWYVRNYNGSGFNDVANVSTNVWHSWNIFYYPTVKKVSIYLDNSWKGNFTSFGNSATLDKMYIGDPTTSSYAGDEFIYYDDLFEDNSIESGVTVTLLYGIETLTILNTVNRNILFSRSGLETENFVSIEQRTITLVKNVLITENLLSQFQRKIGISRTGIESINLISALIDFVFSGLGGLIPEVVTVNITFSNIFWFLIILFGVCLFLSIIRIPIFGFVFSAFAIGFSAWSLTDLTLPLYGLINTFIAVMGAICLYLNVEKFRNSSYTKKHTSKLARRF